MELLNLIIYGLFSILMIIVINKKDNYHMDEILSYGLSNHQIKVPFKEGRYESPYKIFYQNYMVVNKKSRFNYHKVWINQSKDVHPPLYYTFLHTICSFFPEKFSPWYAGSINMFFALLTLYTLRKLILNLTNNKEICNIVSFAFILSPGILSAITYFRMYILAMFFITLLEYTIIKEIDNKFDYNFYFFYKLYFISVFGALIHYYCIFFTITTCFIFLILLLIKRKWVSILLLIITGILAGLTTIWIFPAMIRHIFYGYRGVQSFTNLKKQSKKNYWFKILIFYKMINKDLFGNYFIIIILFNFILLLINIYFDKKKTKLGNKDYFLQIAYNKLIRNTTIKYFILFTSSLIYFLFITKIAVYNHNRFLVPIYTITFISFFSLMFLLFFNLIKKKNYSYPLVILLLTFIFGNEWNIFWKRIFIISLSDPLQNYSNLNCIFIYDKRWKILRYLLKYKNCRLIKFIRNRNKKKKKFFKDKTTQLVLMIINDLKIDVKRLIKFFPKINSYKRIPDNSDLKIYYLYLK